MTARRDKSGALVTDYSRSSIEPDRAAVLNKAELDYVNGIWDAELEQWTWPSYPQLAGKYDLPLRLINEQAAKHKWVSRRERRKTEMIAFQNETTRARWLDEDRQIMGMLMTNLGKNVELINRVHDEQLRLARRAIREEARLREEEGEEDPLVLSGVRTQTLKELAQASAEVMKTSRALNERIVGLPTVLPEIAPPVLLLTAEQEAAHDKEIERLATPEDTLLEIYKEMAKIEESRKRVTIVGELDDEDDDG